MSLRDYLKLHDLTNDAFGARIGVSGMAVSRYLKGAVPKKKATVINIFKVTDGAVDPNALYGVKARKKRRRRAPP